MAKETIYDQLKKEHEEVKELFKRAENCSPKERAAVLHEIEENLIPHSRGEEKTLYSLSRQRAKDSNMTESFLLANEAYEEHHVADEILQELKSLDVESERWLPLLKVLKENIEHHIREEEGSLFAEVKKLFNKEEEALLLEDYMEAKEDYLINLPQQIEIDERTPSVKAQHDFYAS